MSDEKKHIHGGYGNKPLVKEPVAQYIPKDQTTSGIAEMVLRKKDLKNEQESKQETSEGSKEVEQRGTEPSQQNEEVSGSGEIDGN